MLMTDAPILYAALMLVIPLICGLPPILSKIKEDFNKMKIMTGIAAGIILASALLVIIPEGYEIASETDHDSHDEEDHDSHDEEDHGSHDEEYHDSHDEESLAGDIALAILEFHSGDINASKAIEEIENLIGGHEGHEEDHDSHDEENHEGDEEVHDEHESESEISLSESVEHVIEEVESSEINASTGLEEIQALITSHSQEHGESEDEHTENHSEDEHTENHSEDEHANGLLFGGAILIGFLLMLILEGFGFGHAVHEEHHDHEDTHNHGHVHHGSSGWILVFGLTMHALTDGIAIGAAAASGSIAITTTVFIAVLIHKGPAAFSLGVFSMHERETQKDAIRDLIIFSIATPIMMIFSFFVFEDLETNMIGLIMLFSAGTFLYVATVDTLPDIHNPVTGKKSMLTVLFGALLFALVLFGLDAADLIEHSH